MTKEEAADALEHAYEIAEDGEPVKISEALAIEILAHLRSYEVVDAVSKVQL